MPLARAAGILRGPDVGRGGALGRGSRLRDPAPQHLVLAWLRCWSCHTGAGTRAVPSLSDPSSEKGLITALPHRVVGRSRWRNVRKVVGTGFWLGVGLGNRFSPSMKEGPVHGVLGQVL